MLENEPNLKGMDILVMEGDPASAKGLADSLEGFGAEVRLAEDVREAKEEFARRKMHAVLADLDIMDEGSEDFIREYKKENPGGLFFLLMEPGTTVTTPDPSGLMVDDYLQKPVDVVYLAHMLESGVSTALTVVDPLVSRVRPYFQFRSSSMRRALADLPRIAASDQTVLISGETGTGKEIISRAIHVMSPRSNGPFVALNCGAIPEGLIEDELFGHEKGAFTGAGRLRRGKIETAHKGTLLLDEIGDMPMSLQVRLLRVLEERQITRVGGERPIPVSVRVIAATNRELKSAVQEGLFREDLYYRLNVLRIHLPPLGARKEDIPILAVHFMDRAFAEMGLPEPFPPLSSAAVELLERLPWKGNVRELRNVMTRVATFLPRNARQVLPMHVLPHIEDTVPPSAQAETPSRDGVFIPTGTTLKESEDMLIENALRETGGNRTSAARMLGIGVRTLRRKLNERGR